METGLRTVPIAALHDGEQFLIENYSVGMSPSLSLTNTNYQDLREVPLLAMGASEFNDQSPLPTVPVELQAIAQDIWQGQSSQFLNESFTLDNLKAQRQQTPYGIIHLATHADFRPGVLGNSYIQLHGNERLRMDQIRDLGWNDPPPGTVNPQCLPNGGGQQ
jgi:CHAT domain-containing protein